MLSARDFELKATVFENVKELRRVLGALGKPLSMDALAGLIAVAHPDGRSVGSSTVDRWERGTEPDFESTAIMAAFAGVTFEQFARGANAQAIVFTLDPANARKLTPAEVRRAREKAAREHAAENRPTRKKKRGEGQ